PQKGVWLMTAHTGLAFQERLRLERCHLLGVTGVAYAQGRRGRDGLCCDLAMANGALDIGGAMGAAFPLGIGHLVAGGTGFPGRNCLMVLLPGLSLLSTGRLEGSSKNEKKEEGGIEQRRAETIHGQNS